MEKQKVQEQIVHLYQLLASRITGVQLNRSIPLQLRAQMSACRFADTRRTRDQDTTETARVTLVFSLGSFFEARWPLAVNISHVILVVRAHHEPVTQPGLKLLDLAFISTYLFKRLWGIAICPKLH